MIKNFETIKYKIVRLIESNPILNLFIYNNIRFFKFLLPHEKDFYGMLLLCKNQKKKIILDIGASLGISSLGFRHLGFKNIIYAFEPNYHLYNYYLKEISKKNNNIFVKNIALGNSNKSKILYMPFYKSRCIHYFCSFDKKYLINSIKITFPNLLNRIVIKTKKIQCRKFDDLNLKIEPHFIKIDTEGYDEFVLKGLKKTMNKYKPVFLMEYNKEYYKNIKKILKDYIPHVYDLKTNKMLKLAHKIDPEKISRTTKSNYLSVRNIYFLPKRKKSY
tara:strand:- start:445 stop:1269 length:825 start_codon:yes stop_codon:yes gene_type:complete